MGKNTIRLTETDLKKIISESVEKCLSEMDSYEGSEFRTSQEAVESIAGELLKVMEPMSLIYKLGSRIGFGTLRRYLEHIANIELNG